MMFHVFFVFLQKILYLKTMGIVKIKDKSFKTSIPEAEILKKVQVVADRINKDYEGKKPVFLAVLNGAFIFAADLMRMITIPSEISFVKYASYEGTTSTGSMKTLMGINQDLEGRDVIIVEDIIDTGITLCYLKKLLLARSPKSLKVCASLDKPSRRKADFKGDYIGFEIENEFVVGYGLDYDEKMRNFKDVCVLAPEVYGG